MNNEVRDLNIVLLGAPGSGKGTQAEKLCQAFDVPHIATGDLFRENLRNNTELGKLARSYMDRGDLVPDDVTVAMVEDRLSRPDTAHGFVFDGFPRNHIQAEAFSKMLDGMGRKLGGVIYFKVSDQEIITRLSGRLICRNCQTPFHLTFNPPRQEGVCDVCGGELYQRDDDKPDTVRARLETYRKQTAPLIDYYTAAGLLVEVDGEGELSAVTERIMAAARQLAPA